MGLKVRKRSAPPLPPGCPIEKCMELLGGLWTPHIVWELSGKPRRFGELENDIPGISPKMLSTRLKRLERQGAVIRRVIMSSPPSVEYSLSEHGRELVPVINAIVQV